MLLTPPPGKRARVSVISLVGLPSDEQRQSFVNQLQMALFAWIKRNPAGDRPLRRAVRDGRGADPRPVEGNHGLHASTLALASQARKYGLGLVFATQAPKGLHNQIPGNATTQFFGLLNAPAQIAAAQEMARAKGGDARHQPAARRQLLRGDRGGGVSRIAAPWCLSYHPASPPSAEEVLGLARGSSD